MKQFKVGDVVTLATYEGLHYISEINDKKLTIKLIQIDDPSVYEAWNGIEFTLNSFDDLKHAF